MGFINTIEGFIDHCTNPSLKGFILCGDFTIYLLPYENK